MNIKKYIVKYNNLIVGICADDTNKQKVVFIPNRGVILTIDINEFKFVIDSTMLIFAIKTEYDFPYRYFFITAFSFKMYLEAGFLEEF